MQALPTTTLTTPCRITVEAQVVAPPNICTNNPPPPLTYAKAAHNPYTDCTPNPPIELDVLTKLAKQLVMLSNQQTQLELRLNLLDSTAGGRGIDHRLTQVVKVRGPRHPTG